MNSEKIIENIQRFVVYGNECTKLELGVPECRYFWYSAILFVIAVICVILIVVIYRALKMNWDIKMHEKMLAEKAKIADEVTMKKVKWQPVDELDDIDHDAIANQIRESLQSKKPE